MGLIDWIKRKKEETRLKNEMTSQALQEYYKSDAYKLKVAKDIHENKPGTPGAKGKTFGDFIKNASANAVKTLNAESNHKLDIDKFTVKKKTDDKQQK